MKPLSAKEKSNTHVMSATDVDNAVGVPKRNWYVAVVRRNTEKACREKLEQMGYECYVATQNELRQWKNGQRKTIERVVISTIVFIKTTEQQRLQLVKEPFINRFMTNRLGKVNNFGRHPIATIPDKEMNTLKFMLYNSEHPVSFIDSPLKKGERIRVVRGSLKGLEGNVCETSDATYVMADLNILGCAVVRVSIEDIERAGTKDNEI